MRPLPLLLGTSLILALACASNPKCGEGTHESGGECVSDTEESDSDTDADSDSDTDADSDSDTDADTDTDTDADTVSVYDVNAGDFEEGRPVTLEGLVVTSQVTRDGDGFFVAAPAGGPRSGLYVWRSAGFDSLFVSEGDEVRITGTPADYYGWTELVVDDLADIEVTGTASVPEPMDLGDGEGVDWEDYESMAVVLEDQTVTALDDFNVGTLSSGVQLDDGFVYLDYTCGTRFSSVSGIVFYRYEAHSINPRSTGELDGATDPGTSSTTVAAVQAGDVCGTVRLSGVIATAPSVVHDDGSTTFFVQDPGGASGVAVYVPGYMLTIDVGDVLTLSGRAEEFYDFTQVRVTDAATWLEVTGSSTPIALPHWYPPGDWEPYEGMLVELRDVAVTSAPSYGEVDTNYDIKIDDLYFDHGATDGDRFDYVTGVVNYSYAEWKLEPRSAADLVR